MASGSAVPKHEHSPGLSDEALLESMSSGCSECFGMLFHRYFRLVFTIAYKILRDHSEAEDILQEVFLAIFLQQERFDMSRGSVKTWVLQFAYFKSLRRRRYLRIQDSHAVEEAQDSAGIRRNSHLAIVGMNASECARCVEEGMSKLNERQRRVIELVHFQGRTLLECSEIMRQSMPNTRNHYYRGIEALRDFLAARTEEQNASDAKAAHQALRVYRLGS